MKPGTLLALAALTLLLLIAAVFTWRSRRIEPRVEQEQQLFPALTDRANEVQRVTIEGQEQALHIGREGATWRVEELGGYPANFEQVKAMVLDLSRLEIVESKTDNPELYDRIGVQEPDAEGATSTRVTLDGADGGQIVSVVLSQPQFETRQPRRFARRGDETTSWLVEGAVEISTSPMSWVDAELLRIGRERVRSVDIDHPDGESLFIHRETRDQASFDVADIPEGRELQNQGIAGTIGGAIAFLRFNGVAPAAEHPLDPEQTTVTQFRTFDGLVITVRSQPGEGDDVWAHISASYDESAAEQPVQEDEEEGTDVADEQKSPEQVRQEAQELSERFEPWAFNLSSAAHNLRKRMKELLKEVEEAPPADEQTIEEPPAIEPPVEDAALEPGPAPAPEETQPRPEATEK